MCLIAITTLTACPGREVAKALPNPSPIPDKRIRVNSNRKVDILFVIDNSNSMAQEQASLATNFPKFIDVLSKIEGGLPDVHIGVVSTDTGGTREVNCTDTGDDGKLQNSPRVSGCSPPSDAYIEDFGTTGAKNYTGTLADTFSCIAGLGVAGCGFESPLDSARRALTAGKNPGFIRDDALLALIFITDEDDCSMIADSRAAFLTASEASLGKRLSFRCFEYGITCADTGGGIREFTAKDECQSNEGSDFLTPVSEFVDFVSKIKGDPGRVIVAGIIGDPDPSPAGAGYRAAVRPNPKPGALNDTPQLSPSCSSNSGEAFPGIRLTQFIESFAESRTTTICNDDLSDALVDIAELLTKVIGTPCLASTAVEPLDCEAWVESSDGKTLFQVPQCTGTGVAPCWSPKTDPICNGAPGVEYTAKGNEPLNSRFRIQCVGEAPAT